MLAHDRFTRITQIGRLTDLGSLGKATAPSESLLASLRERFERHQESIMAAVDTRSRERLQHLSNTIGQRMEAALADVEAILTTSRQASAVNLIPTPMAARPTCRECRQRR